MDVQGVIVGLNTVCFIVHTIVRFAKRGSQKALGERKQGKGEEEEAEGEVVPLIKESNSE